MGPPISQEMNVIMVSDPARIPELQIFVVHKQINKQTKKNQSPTPSNMGTYKGIRDLGPGVNKVP